MVFAQDNDTIVASATAPGVAGIGIVRISGNNISTYITEIINDDLEPRKASYKSFYDSNKKVIDQGIVIYFPSPDSFTGEDVAEFHCHGGKIIMEMVIERCLELGARLARPGEFSERAFLNDKIDLIQAESISDLINASSKASAQSALLSMQGVFSDLVNELIEEIINLRKFVEACIDFPAEDIDFLKDDDLTNGLNNCIKKINLTIQQAQQGRVIQEGVRLAIVGKPNAGKSSLFNLFAGEDLAIVTDIPGTTRDLLKENVFIDDLPVYLTDSAGPRETIDPIEAPANVVIPSIMPRSSKDFKHPREIALINIFYDSYFPYNSDSLKFWEKKSFDLKKFENCLKNENKKCYLPSQYQKNVFYISNSKQTKLGKEIFSENIKNTPIFINKIENK